MEEQSLTKNKDWVIEWIVEQDLNSSLGHQSNVMFD